MSEFETFLNTVSSGEQRSLLSYGPAEADELQKIQDAGFQVAAVNLLNKTPIDGVRYLQQGVKMGADYDIVAIFMLLSTYFVPEPFNVVKSLLKWLTPVGELWLTVPMGRRERVNSRQYGPVDVFDRHDLIDFISGASGMQVQLIHESYYLDHEQVGLKEIEGTPAVLSSQIRQVALYGFRKISAKKRSKDAVERDHDTVIVPSNMVFIPREEIPTAPVQLKGASSWPHAWV